MLVVTENAKTSAIIHGDQLLGVALFRCTLKLCYDAIPSLNSVACNIGS